MLSSLVWSKPFPYDNAIHCASAIVDGFVADYIKQSNSIMNNRLKNRTSLSFQLQKTSGRTSRHFLVANL